MPPARDRTRTARSGVERGYPLRPLCLLNFLQKKNIINSRLECKTQQPIYHQNGQNRYPIYDQKDWTIPSRASLTWLARARKYPSRTEGAEGTEARRRHTRIVSSILRRNNLRSGIFFWGGGGGEAKWGSQVRQIASKMSKDSHIKETCVANRKHNARLDSKKKHQEIVTDHRPLTSL